MPVFGNRYRFWRVKMAKYDYDFGIIGGGSAGLSAASISSQLGAKTLLFEKEHALGGDCLHFGCVPSKTLIRSARVYHLMKNAEKLGLSKVNVPPVDFKKIRDRIQSVIAHIQKHDSVERFCKLGAQVEFGDATFTDAHTVKLNGKDFSAKKWLIATGSSAFVPPIDGLGDTPFITNREIFSLEKLPKSMVVIGAGPIGIEMGQSFSRFGTDVTIVDMADQILNKEDRDMADAVMNVMGEEGVKFLLKASIVKVGDRGTHREVTVKTGDGKAKTLKCDTILVSVGRRPNTGGLGLESIGVELDRGFIKVDNRLRTNMKHIYGAGDVIGGYLFTHSGGYEGSIVTVNAIGHMPKKVNYTYLPWCTYTEPELANIGLNEKRAKDAGVKYTVIKEEFKNNDRSVAEGHMIGHVKMLLDEKEKPIGIQILGPEAGTLIGEWVAVLNGGVKLSTLASSVHPFPTLGEINFRVAGKRLAEKFYSEKMKKILKFFFNLRGRACEPDMLESGSS
jgi:pyruvate/2-oxoglutarate dehydrogenase complex dihydrolipoamide dehydrogenase (E3) component